MAPAGRADATYARSSCGLTRRHRDAWCSGCRPVWSVAPAVAAEPAQSLVVVGPTQSGKTTRLAVPAILAWRGPVVAASVKSDLLHYTLGTCSRRGQVWCLDPTASTTARRSRWSPLTGCRELASRLSDRRRPVRGRQDRRHDCRRRVLVCDRSQAAGPTLLRRCRRGPAHLRRGALGGHPGGGGGGGHSGASG